MDVTIKCNSEEEKGVVKQDDPKVEEVDKLRAVISKTTNSSNKNDEREDTARTASLTFLTLGDGDFSYSLDLARYLASYDFNKLKNTYEKGQQRRIRLIATGIDSPEEVLEKYRDSIFLLKELKAMDNTLVSQQTSSSSDCSLILSVEVKHGINAIVDGYDDDKKSNNNHDDDDDKNDEVKMEICNYPTIDASDHVIFNHPHLGTEDAVLHSRMLCHLFYAATKVWMKPFGGLFHLTLVKGQYERWKCHSAARRHGLILIDQRPFQPPTPMSSPAVGRGDDDGTGGGDQTRKTIKNKKQKPINYYQYRRHQTGKSFESRRAVGGSQTFTFIRAKDQGTTTSLCLPWQQDNDKQKKKDGKDSLLQSPESNLLSCPFCDKGFSEERSRKCHVRAKHDSPGWTVQQHIKRRKQGNDEHGSYEDMSHTKQEVLKLLQCKQCARSFQSEQALADHVRAKHSGIHRENIQPDWYKGDQEDKNCNDDTKHDKAALSTAVTSNDKSDAGDNETTLQNQTVSEDRHQDFGSCTICSIMYNDSEHASRHKADFIPASAMNDTAESFKCIFCFKSFRDNRAKRQHENFCAKQVPPTK